jgi:hypothetical protein
VTSKASFHLHPTRVRSFRWRSLVLPSDLVIWQSSLGKYSTGLVSRVMWQDAWWLQNLSEIWGLGPQRADTVLLIATTMEPASALVQKQRVKPCSMLPLKYMLNVWVSLFPLAAAAAALLEVLPGELS